MYFSKNIYITSGKGGNGYFPKSGKFKKKFDGGNGGKGGSVFICSSKRVRSFNHLSNNNNYKAENGFDGKNGKKKGDRKAHV